jgi:hypothetical protein
MEPVKVNAFRSDRVVVTLQIGSKRYKACQLFFGRDRSLFVNFPYFRHRTGILSAATIPANGQTTSQIDLQNGGKIASHLVKYSHHPDGRAHFSQTGKVRTEIRRQSVALDEQCGHIFTVLIQGIEGFDKADPVKDTGTSPKRTALTFQIVDQLRSETTKLVGRWYDVSALVLGGQSQPTIGPVVTAQDPEGKQLQGFLVASPHDNARHVLFITCQQIPRVSAEPELLIFYGGFSAPDTMNDTTQEAGFLAFTYPAADAEELKKTIGTVDW